MTYRSNASRRGACGYGADRCPDVSGFAIPPSLAGPGFETFTGDGPISYWNNYVGVTQMGGHGSFTDPRIGISITQTPDQGTPKLPPLLEYQLSLQTPQPPAGSFNKAAARRGEELFNGALDARRATSRRYSPTC
jgi:hypothetical protein